jgi:ABC-type dipeptide/oligopeptide/nickel transport system ATPase component
MIKSIAVTNFHALRDFEIDLAHTTCLIGANGAGKSLVVNLILFLSSLMKGKTVMGKEMTPTGLMTFQVVTDVATWRGVFDPAEWRCVEEQIVTDTVRLDVEKDVYTITSDTSVRSSIDWDYDGSILSRLRRVPFTILPFKQAMSSITNTTPPVLSETSRNKLTPLFKDLGVDLVHGTSGTAELCRIFAELDSKHYVHLFDEIETSIDGDLMSDIIQNLIACHQQCVVTTHSPLFVNYLSDDTARAGVVYLYKTSQGVKAIHLFAIPSLAKKLGVMGPGEAWADTDMSRIIEEIEAMP